MPPEVSRNPTSTPEQNLATECRTSIDKKSGRMKAGGERRDAQEGGGRKAANHAVSLSQRRWQSQWETWELQDGNKTNSLTYCPIVWTLLWTVFVNFEVGGAGGGGGGSERCKPEDTMGFLTARHFFPSYNAADSQAFLHDRVVA